MSRRTDDISGGSWKPLFTGNILGTTFRALLSPKGKKMGNAEILQAALKSLTSSNLNKCVCFCAGGYCGNDLAVQVAALHCGSNQQL